MKEKQNYFSFHPPIIEYIQCNKNRNNNISDYLIKSFLLPDNYFQEMPNYESSLVSTKSGEKYFLLIPYVLLKVVRENIFLLI
jgi:hypothetical protein